MALNKVYALRNEFWMYGVSKSDTNEVAQMHAYIKVSIKFNSFSLSNF